MINGRNASEAVAEVEVAADDHENEVNHEDACTHEHDPPLPVTTNHLVFNHSRCAAQVQRQRRHRLRLLNQHLYLLPSLYQFLQVFDNDLIDFFSLFDKTGDVVYLVGRVVELHVVFEDRFELFTTVHVATFDFIGSDARGEQFLYFLEIAKGYPLRVLIIAHYHVDLVNVQHIENIVVG